MSLDTLLEMKLLCVKCWTLGYSAELRALMQMGGLWSPESSVLPSGNLTISVPAEVRKVVSSLIL